MNNITKSPANRLNQIDIKQIHEEFRERLSRLDDLKHARNEHEQQNWLGRWWYKGEMEQAQLDAQILQADFAESLAKLMAINLIQSQQLEQQQHTIILQQGLLAEQNEKLKQQTEALNEQQTELKKQGDDLDKLVRDFFNLKGITEGEARKLIAIANEVKTAKSDMYEHFELCVQELRDEDVALKAFVGDTVSSAIAEQKVALSAAETSFIARYEAQEACFSKYINDVEERYRAIDNRLGEQDISIRQTGKQLTQAIHEHNNHMQAHTDEIRSLAVASEQKMDLKLRQTMLRVWWIAGFAFSALVGALGSLIVTHRFLG